VPAIDAIARDRERRRIDVIVPDDVRLTRIQRATKIGGMAGDVRPGETFAGKYRVERILGEGGFGLVFAARNIELDELVAVKLLKHDGDPVTAERFVREARSATKIRGDNVVRIYAVDQLDDGDLYMVMEYLDGRDLRREVVEAGPLQVPDAVDCVLQACDVIGRAHAIGIVHRDIKSANIFAVRSPDGRRRIKVLDFGIARSLDPVDVSLTQSAAMLGSPNYMAPEQMVDGHNVDERADIWALGATLFELLTGKPPFGVGTLPQVVHRVQSQPPMRLRELRPDAPAGLEAVILECLQKDREKRYPDVGSLVAALEPYAGDVASTLSTNARNERLDVDTTLPLAQQRADAKATVPLDPRVIASDAPARATVPSSPSGIAVPPVAAPVAPRSAVAPKSTTTPLVVAGLVLIGVLAAGVGITRATRSHGDARPDPTESSGTPTAAPMTPSAPTAATAAATDTAAPAPPPTMTTTSESSSAKVEPAPLGSVGARVRGARTPAPTGRSSGNAPTAPAGPTPLPDDRR